MRKFFNFASGQIVPAGLFTAVGAAVGFTLSEIFASPGEMGGVAAGVCGATNGYSSDLPFAKKCYAIGAGSLIAGFTAAVVRTFTGSPVASNAAGALTAYATTKAGLWLLGTNKERRILAQS